MMDTREVAAYLRLKERRIYDLVRANALPHVRATGKLLFPRAADRRLARFAQRASRQPRARDARRAADRSRAATTRCSNGRRANRAAASRSSPAAAARASTASRDGDATVAAMHWLDDATGEYNVPLVRERCPARTSSCSNGRSGRRGCCSRRAIRCSFAVARRPRAKEAARRRCGNRTPAATACSSISLPRAGLDARGAERDRASPRSPRPTSRPPSPTAGRRGHRDRSRGARARPCVHSARDRALRPRRRDGATTSSRRCRRCWRSRARRSSRARRKARRLRRRRHRTRRLQRLTTRASAVDDDPALTAHLDAAHGHAIQAPDVLGGQRAIDGGERERAPVRQQQRAIRVRER